MRTGEQAPAQRGFSYLLLLFTLALGGASLAALGTQWQTQAQREREAELLWRGRQIREAIERYAHAPGAPAALPASLADLLHDTRGGTPRHWLRQLYADPFTGAADWVLLRDDGGGIRGVASRSRRPALRRHGLPAGVVVVLGRQSEPTVGEWQFVADTGPAAKTAAKIDQRSSP